MIKASISEMVSQRGRREDSGGKGLLVEDCREEVLVVKDEVGSVDGLGRIARGRLDWCKDTLWKRSKV